MNGKKTLLLLIIVWLFTAGFSQTPFKLDFIPVWGGENLELESRAYTNWQGDTVYIDAFRFYISGIELLENKKVVWSEMNSFHLLDAASPQSLSILLEIPDSLTFPRLRLWLGIDSVSSVSGAMGGDLDPSLGMYWTWNSGYINLKLEGRSSRCPARKQRFQFHLGGYAAPFDSQKCLEFDLAQSGNARIYIPVDEFLRNLDLAETYRVMVPGIQAVNLAQRFAKLIETRREDD